MLIPTFPSHRSFTLRDLAAAAAWAAQQGRGWGAVAIRSDDGLLGIGLMVPGSRGLISLFLDRTAEGIAVFDAEWSSEAIGVFPSLSEACEAGADYLADLTEEACARLGEDAPRPVTG